MAQTYEFDKEDNLFNQPGETSHFSDYVGRIYAAPSQYFDMNYRFKLDKEDFKITYSELGASLGSDILRLYTSYIFFPEAENYAEYIDTHRKEIYMSINSKITRNWSIDMFARQDLVNDHTISNGGGIIYEDECSRFALHLEKEFSDDPKDENEITVYFSFFLKTIGSVGTN